MTKPHDPAADRLARAEERLRHPRPGSRIEAAQNFGIDLTLLIEKMRLSPEERVRRMHDAAHAAEQVRGAARPNAHELLSRRTGLKSAPRNDFLNRQPPRTYPMTIL
jgi:hypothetical protein